MLNIQITSGISRCLTILLPILLSVAFMTIIERKSFEFISKTKGPNTVGWYGVFTTMIIYNITIK